MIVGSHKAIIFIPRYHAYQYCNFDDFRKNVQFKLLKKKIILKFAQHFFSLLLLNGTNDENPVSNYQKILLGQSNIIHIRTKKNDWTISDHYFL